MKCTHCGADIPEDQLYCGICGKEVQIVPDYNPLDEMLAAQVKGVIDESNRNTNRNRNTGRMPNRNTGTSGRSNTVNSGRRNTGAMNSRNTGKTVSRNTGKTTGRNVQETEPDQVNRERAAKKQQAKKRKALAKKRRRRLIIVMLIIIAAAIGGGILLYQSSYTGLVNNGYKKLENAEYQQAERYFNKAIAKDKTKAEAYIGRSKVYQAQDDLDKAEQLLLDAIGDQPDNIELYEAILEFYVEIGQEEKISILLAECRDEDILKQLKKYISDVPEFSLDDDRTYDEVQELSMSSSGETIYYTLDGTASTVESQRYTKPIQLGEGETVVRAISVNEEGIPSLEISKTYTIELPTPDAPAVTPSTGQYEEAVTIEIKVPDGYTAYYTANGAAPDPDDPNTKEYSGPIDMPQGKTLFSAIVVSANGKVSDVTKRNYELSLN